MLRKTICLVISLCFIACFSQCLLAQDFTVKHLQVDIEVARKGYFDVTETYDVFFNEPRHGIFRVIPRTYTLTTDSGTTERRTISLSKIHASSTSVSESWNSQTLSLRLGNADTYVTDSQRYIIKYRVKKAFLSNASNTIFYWNIKGNEWQVPFEKIDFNVHFLDTTLNLTPNDYYTYLGQQGSTERTLKIHYNQDDDNTSASNETTSVDAAEPATPSDSCNDDDCIVKRGITEYSNNTVKGEVHTTLQGDENVTVLVYLPKDFLIKPTKAELFWENWGWSIFAFLLIVVFYTIWRLFGKSEKIIKTVCFYPPKGIDPAMAGFIINDKSDDTDLTALIPHWGAYGYITLEEKKKEGWFGRGDTILHKIKDLPADAPLHESLVFDGLFKDRQSVHISTLKESFYSTMEQAKSSLKKAANTAGYHNTSGEVLKYTAGCLLLLIAVVGSILIGIFFNFLGALAFFIVSIVLFTLTPKLVRRTQKVHPILQDLEGFKMFIEKAEQHRLETLLKEDPAYFEKTLGYALAFGMIKQWGKKFEGLSIQPPSPSWYIGAGIGASMFSPSRFTNDFSHTISSAKEYMVSTPPSSSSGSGGGGWSSSSSGGGSSGGGFGGGGGGSW